MLQSNVIDETVPRIVIFGRWDWESRLEVARTNVQLYLRKPLDLFQLIERLDALTRITERQLYRVLILDDELSLCAHYAEVLKNAGMEVAVITQPSQIIEALESSRPELLLLDLYMPNCSGIEVATVVRQNLHYDNMPIVFLSGEKDRKIKIKAMQVGADDFLHKPIEDWELIAVVYARARRFRALNLLSRQDSLTGLFNHVAFKEEVKIELGRAVRNGEQLSLVMIDIDQFKKVNDSFGHPVGDWVIRNLSRFLRKRLRGYDSVGRYGGEEFAILMPGTSISQANTIIDALRMQFCQIKHHDNPELLCSFSAGIASFPKHSSCETLIFAADQALYRAKLGGRNAVVNDEDDLK